MNIETSYVCSIILILAFGLAGSFIGKVLNEGIEVPQCLQIGFFKNLKKIPALFTSFQIPPVVWALISGLVVRNSLEKYNFMGVNFPDKWTYWMRQCGFGILVCSGCYSINYDGIGLISFLLALVPAFCEAALFFLLSLILFEMPTFVSLAVGGLSNAVAPSVLIFIMLWCQENKLGTEKGIISISLASGNINMVFSLILFQIFKSKVFALINPNETFSIDSIRLNLFDQIILGCLIGYIFGLAACLVKK